MKKIKFIVLAVVVLSLGTVSSIKAYNGFVKSSGLVQSNIESLTSNDVGDIIFLDYKVGSKTENGVTIPCCISEEGFYCNYTQVSCVKLL